MLIANFSPGALEPIITHDLNFVNIWLRDVRQKIRVLRTQWSFPVSKVGKKASNFLSCYDAIERTRGLVKTNNNKKHTKKAHLGSSPDVHT